MALYNYRQTYHTVVQKDGLASVGFPAFSRVWSWVKMRKRAIFDLKVICVGISPHKHSSPWNASNPRGKLAFLLRGMGM